ncbi:unnamed protein product [Pedinophyceae sp. YPF-701]|nr:unnamed protein product [Pedinophyceae sp. YPF-701]
MAGDDEARGNLVPPGYSKLKKMKPALDASIAEGKEVWLVQLPPGCSVNDLRGAQVALRDEQGGAAEPAEWALSKEHPALARHLAAALPHKRGVKVLPVAQRVTVMHGAVATLAEEARAGNGAGAPVQSPSKEKKAKKEKRKSSGDAKEEKKSKKKKKDKGS